MAHMKLGKILCAWLAALMLMLSFTSCAGSEEPQEVEQDGWVSIWATAAQLADMDQIPTEPSLLPAGYKGVDSGRQNPPDIFKPVRKHTS